MPRHALSDTQWDLIKDVFPRRAKTGRPPADFRKVFDACLWNLNTGAPWRDLPEEFGRWQTVYHHYNHWSKSGLLERLLQTLHARLEADGSIDWSLFCVDGTHVRAHVSAAGAGKKGGLKSRKTTRSDGLVAASAARSTL
jgi:transposase